MNDLYWVGHSFKNPKVPGIPVIARDLKFLSYGAGRGVSPWTQTIPAWERSDALKRRVYDKGGLGMSDLGLGAWWYGRMIPRGGGEFRVATADRRPFMSFTGHRLNRRAMPLTGAIRKDLFRRSAKGGTLSAIGLGGVGEMPNFGEVALGQTTVNVDSSTARSAWGFLTNIIGSAAETVKMREERKLTTEQVKAAEAAAAITAARAQERRAGAAENWPLYLGLGGGALLVVALVLKRRRK